MALYRIARHTDHHGAGGFIRLDIIAEVLRFDGAARRIVFWVKIDDFDFAFKCFGSDVLRIIKRHGKVRRFIAYL